MNVYCRSCQHVGTSVAQLVWVVVVKNGRQARVRDIAQRCGKCFSANVDEVKPLPRINPLETA
jgi:hypothetical protein